MIGIYNTIQINGVDVYRPTEFNIEREDVYSGEYTTCTGAIRADRIGWKYADTVLAWDTLPDSMLSALLSIGGAVSMTFTDKDGSHTEQVIRTQYINAPTRHTMPDGSVIWRNIELGLRFIDVHN